MEIIQIANKEKIRPSDSWPKPRKIIEKYTNIEEKKKIRINKNQKGKNQIRS